MGDLRAVPNAPAKRPRRSAGDAALLVVGDSRMMEFTQMPETMSKCLNMGIPLSDVIRLSTVEPAKEIRRPELGTLSVGAEADVAVLEMIEGDFGFVDSGRARLRGSQRLQCALTLRAGELVWDRNGLSRPDWDTAGEYKRAD